MTCHYHPTLPATHRWLGGTTRLCGECAALAMKHGEGRWAAFIVPIEEAA